MHIWQSVDSRSLSQVNEFHHAPVDFIFTSPLNDSVLPPLRVSGDGVLREFGFVPGRGWLDAAMVWVLVACFGSLTYLFLETAGRTGQQSLWGISMAWLQSLRKRRRVSSGLASDSPLAGVSQELAGAEWTHALHAMHAVHAMHAALKCQNSSVFIELNGRMESQDVQASMKAQYSQSKTNMLWYQFCWKC